MNGETSPFKKWPNAYSQYVTNNFDLFFREAREAKRGGTAPGESRISKHGGGVNFELNKIYAVNPRIQKINIASPNIKNS